MTTKIKKKETLNLEGSNKKNRKKVLTIDTSSKLQSLVKTLRSDVKYKRLKHTFNTHENFRLPLESLSDELRSMHKVREVRRLNPTDPKFVDALISAALDDQSKRSRITEIMVQCLRSHSLLVGALDSLKFYLIATYPNELRSFRTKEERSQIVNLVLKPFDSYLKDVAVLKESAQLVAADIDKSAWSLKLVSESLKLHIAPERHL